MNAVSEFKEMATIGAIYGIISEFRKRPVSLLVSDHEPWKSEMTAAHGPVAGRLRVAHAADLGLAVRATRREQSLRIDDAATLSGVSVDLLSRLENGKGTVRLDKLLTVLDGLGLTLVVCRKDDPWLESVHPDERFGRP